MYVESRRKVSQVKLPNLVIRPVHVFGIRPRGSWLTCLETRFQFFIRSLGKAQTTRRP